MRLGGEKKPSLPKLQKVPYFLSNEIQSLYKITFITQKIW